MKYKRIGHQKTYKPFEFVYEKIELTEDFPIDKPDEECIKELVERIESMAKVAYPNLYQQEKSFVSALAASLRSASNPYPEPVSVSLSETHFTNGKYNVEEQPQEEQKPLLQLIQESKTVRELNSWRVLMAVAKNKDELHKAYDEKMEQLQNQPA